MHIYIYIYIYIYTYIRIATCPRPLILEEWETGTTRKSELFASSAVQARQLLSEQASPTLDSNDNINAILVISYY